MKVLPELDGGEIFPELCPCCGSTRTTLAMYACGAVYCRLDPLENPPREGPKWGGVCPVGDEDPVPKFTALQELDKHMEILDKSIEELADQFVVVAKKTQKVRRLIIAMMAFTLTGCASDPLPAGATGSLTIALPGVSVTFVAARASGAATIPVTGPVTATLTTPSTRP